MEMSTIINYGFYAFLAIYVLFGAIIGCIRGFRRQVVRLVTVAISAVVAFIVSIYLYDTFVSWLTSMGAEGILNMTGATVDEATRNVIISIDTEFIVYVASIPFIVVIAPLSMVLLYGIFAFITWIIHKIVCGALGFTRANNNGLTRFGGFLVGAVQGLLIALITLMPVLGVLDTADMALEDAEGNRPDNEYTQFLTGAYDTYFSELEENPVYGYVSDAAVLVYDRYMNVELYGENVHMKEAVSTLVDIYVATGDLDGADFMKLRAQDKAVINDIVIHAMENKYLATIMSDLLKTFSHMIEYGSFSIDLSANEKVQKLINDVIIILGTSSTETVTDDVTTFKNIYYILSDGGVLAASREENPDLFAMFTTVDESGKTLMSRMNDELVKNPRTLVLCADIAEVAMVLVLQNSGISDTVAPETIQNVKGSLNEIASMNKEDYESEDAYKAAVSDTLSTTLEESNIALEPEQMEAVTDFVINEFEGKEEVTDEDMVNFMSQYYDAYVSGELELPEGTDIPDDLIPET